MLQFLPSHQRRVSLWVLLLAVCLATSKSPVVAEDWPQWRGPQRDGTWQAEGIVKRLATDELQLDWSVEIGPGYNGPTVADGRVYVMDRQTEGRQTERILCFDSATGKQLWLHEYDAPYTISYTAGPRASVTIQDGKAYAVGAMGHFHCLDAVTGKVVWQHDLASEYDVDMPIWGIAASPLIYENLVIEQVAATDATLVAFDKETGQEVWRALQERAAYSSPILIRQAGQDVLVCWTGESLSGLDPSTGKLHWAHPMKPVNMPIGIVTPVVNGDLIFVSSFYDGSLMIRVHQDALTSELVWRARGIDEKSTGSDSVQLKDKTLSGDGVYGIHTMIGTPIVSEDYIYAVDSYGEFRCLDALTGKRIWEDQSAVPRNRWATIHMVQTPDQVWMFNEAGELMTAELAPQGLTITSRAKLISPTRVQLNRRDGVCWSHPAFAEQSVFARNDNQLVRASLAE